jgi:two-component system, NarL family, nitrate/nitrite response regulator NarL
MTLATLVLVEDNPVFLGLLTAFFENTQPKRFTIAGTARSGEDGLTLVAERQPTAVVVDLKLPGISGLDVITRLRSEARQIALVALSSTDADAFRNSALEAGADAFVPKDRLHTDLLPALRRAVLAHANPVSSGDHVDG